MLLQQKANEIRKYALEGIFSAKSGHPGGSLSIADIMAVLFFDTLNIDPGHPQDPNRDRFVLSKGHAAPALYAALALKGYFPKEELSTLRNVDSNLQGHPCMNKIKGVDMSTGSLGQGLSTVNGMALAAKFDKADYKVYTILGDGETQEGQVWEAAQTAHKYKLDNLVVIVDNNNLQNDSTCDEIMPTLDLAKKFEAFGFDTITIDGHCMDQVVDALAAAKIKNGKPKCIIGKTVKGKGVSFMENQVGFHGAAPNDEQYKIAMTELNGRGK